jgi:hypothetical protein
MRQEVVMRWVTRERPKIDRLACPWLVTRFIDPDAEFLFVPADRVLDAARETGAIPYDVPGVALTHVGELCSFDAFLAQYELDQPGLASMAIIVRAADTDHLASAPEAAGLLAISIGLGRVFADDQELLGHAMPMYDALYAWCRGDREQHGWSYPS